MKIKSVTALSTILLLAGTMLAQVPSKLFTKSSPPLYDNQILIGPGRAQYSPGCNTFASVLSVLAIPCNGVSVTSVEFNPTGRTVEAGTNNTVNVRYRYPNVGVAPDGTVIDALVTVTGYNNNQDPTPTTFRDADLPGATAGFDQNLQPSLQPEAPGTFTTAAPWVGNITYRIQFVVSGTSTPRVITIAATSIDNDGSTACGGLRERVTYSTPNQILRSTTTNQTILAGNIVEGPQTVQANIGVGQNFASSALFVNVTEFNWTQGWTTSGNCVVGANSEVRYGSLNLACQIDFDQDFASVPLSGNVFNDTDGLTAPDLTVNGTGTGTPSGLPLFANLIDANGFIVASVPVTAGGAYTFPAVVAGSYSVQISTNQGVESSLAPALTLPPGWVNTGENLGAGAGNDGSVNGLLPVTVAATAISNANFGIEQRPVANNNTAATQVNPGGTTNLTVPPGTFTSTDTAPGSISSIRITAFPLGITSITINGIPYTSTTFPVGGVTVPTNAAGNPTQPILVDPFDGNRTINIPFVAIDNAGFESLSPGTATLPVSAGTTAADVDISGRVLDSQGRGASHTLIFMSGQNGNVRSAITNPFGYYRFGEVEVGQIYILNVRHKRLTYDARTLTLFDSLTDLDFVPRP